MKIKGESLHVDDNVDESPWGGGVDESKSRDVGDVHVDENLVAMLVTGVWSQGVY